MNVTATNEPCMILETVELLYAFINELPAGELTAPAHTPSLRQSCSTCWHPPRRGSPGRTRRCSFSF